jgi:lipoyl(octanoyl) transferase
MGRMLTPSVISLAGVWVGDDKVAAVGISSSRWITTHGFALNVNPNLDYFDTSVILPCGIEGKGVTSMARVLTERGENVPTMHEVASVVVQTMEQVFGVRLEQDKPLR